MMFLITRDLTHLCDALPSSFSVIVHHGAIPTSCLRLLAIEYMDLAEHVCHFLSMKFDCVYCIRVKSLLL